MNTFRTKTYQLKSDKLPEGVRLRFALLADLHGVEHGEDNEELLQAIHRMQPDAVLIAGDMVVRGYPKTLDVARNLLYALSWKYPVYLAPGNHESGMSRSESLSELYQTYEEGLCAHGVQVLHNQSAGTVFRGVPVQIYGLDLPKEYYKKPRSPKLTRGELETLLGQPREDVLNILIAHNPKYAKAYFAWNSDLTVSGHYHGGIVRLSEHRGLACPQYLLFPPFCCGDFHRDGRHMVVSAGLGEHTMPVRIHNPRELLFIDISGPDDRSFIQNR